jgi:hypothetical protein
MTSTATAGSAAAGSAAEQLVREASSGGGDVLGIARVEIMSASHLSASQLVGVRRARALATAAVLAMVFMMYTPIALPAAADRLSPAWWGLTLVVAAVLYLAITAASQRHLRFSRIALLWRHAFVVASFGWRCYRSKLAAADLDQGVFAWNNLVMFLVRREEAAHSIKFSVYAKHTFRPNELLGECHLPLTAITALASQSLAEQAGAPPSSDTHSPESASSNGSSSSTSSVSADTTRSIMDSILESIKNRTGSPSGTDRTMTESREFWLPLVPPQATPDKAGGVNVNPHLSLRSLSSSLRERSSSESLRRRHLRRRHRRDSESGEPSFATSDREESGVSGEEDVEEEDEEDDDTGKGDDDQVDLDKCPKLHIRVEFIRGADLQRRAWEAFIKGFDSSNSGALGRMEFSALLDNLGRYVTPGELVMLVMLELMLTDAPYHPQ